MPNFIEDFYYGNLEPQEMNPDTQRQVKKNLKALVLCEEKLEEKLDERTKELLEVYKEKYNEFLNSCCLDSFTSGFRAGARFTYDTFKKDL